MDNWVCGKCFSAQTSQRVEIFCYANPWPNGLMLKAPVGISWYVIRCISWSLYGSKTSCYQLCQGPLMDWVRGFQTSLLPVWIIHVLGKGYLSYWDCLCHLCVWTHHFQVWEPNTSVQTLSETLLRSAGVIGWCSVCLYIAIATAVLNGCRKLPSCIFLCWV